MFGSPAAPFFNSLFLKIRAFLSVFVSGLRLSSAIIAVERANGHRCCGRSHSSDCLMSHRRTRSLSRMQRVGRVPSGNRSSSHRRTSDLY